LKEYSSVVAPVSPHLLSLCDGPAVAIGDDLSGAAVAEDVESATTSAMLRLRYHLPILLHRRSTA
jgi:hypothetical protein